MVSGIVKLLVLLPFNRISKVNFMLVNKTRGNLKNVCNRRVRGVRCKRWRNWNIPRQINDDSIADPDEIQRKTHIFHPKCRLHFLRKNKQHTVGTNGVAVAQPPLNFSRRLRTLNTESNALSLC